MNPLRDDRDGLRGDGLAADRPATQVPGTQLSDFPLSTFLSLCRATGLDELLREEPDLTVFAPVDSAFAHAHGSGEAAINRDDLALHVYPARLALDRRVKAALMITPYGAPVWIRRQGRSHTVGRARVLAGPFQAANGIIYPVSHLIRHAHIR